MRLQDYRLQQHEPQFKPLSQEKVLKLAESYHNIKDIRYICDNTMIIKTLYDTFFCEITDKHLILKPQVNPKKQHTHLQRIYYDFPYLFNALMEHDTYKITKRGTCVLDYLYNQIAVAK
ncbi:MAG TPA: hypothetical protein DEG71_05030 [Clostridiales bacterium]|nr:hypothetical protein [Clostridiales bacterium]